MREGSIPDDWFARQVGAGRSHRWRHRHAVEPHRPYPDLDLCRQPSRLARRSRALAGRHARGRGQAFGRAARAADRALRRSPHQRADAAAAREHDARNRNQQDRRSRGRGPRDRPARRLPVRARRVGGRLRGQGAAAPRQKALAGEIDARAARLAQAPTSSSCSPPTAPSAGSASAVGKLVAGEEVLRAARAHRRRRAPDRRVARCGAGAARSAGSRPISRSCSRRCSRSSAAEDVTGIARGIAFQLVEALGVLERAQGRRGRQEPRPAGARHAAQIRRALRRLSHLPAGAAQAGAARAGAAALGAQARRRRDQRARRGRSGSPPAGARRSPADKEIRQGALSHRRLSRVRRARGARRYPRAARRPHPAGAGLARRRAPA